MSQSLIDRYPDARRHIATLAVAFGANRRQIADDLARKYTLTKTPSLRSVTSWLADEQVARLIRELEGIRRDLAPGEHPSTGLPEPVDRADAATDLFGLLEEFPAFIDLMHRADNDPGFPDDAPREVLVEGEGKSDEEFAATCRERAGDWSPQGYEIAKHYAKQAYKTPAAYAAYDRFFK